MLFFFLFQSTALFVQIMNRATTFSQLIKEIFNLISKVFVFTFDDVKLFQSLLLCSFQTEKFRAIVATFILRGSNFSCNICSFCLPFSKNLIKVLCTLFSNKSCSMNSLIFHGNVIKVRSKSSFRFFSICNLGLKNINKFFVFHNFGLQFVSGTLKLLNATKPFSLIA